MGSQVYMDFPVQNGETSGKAVFLMSDWKEASDPECMRAVAAGDEDAFSELIERYQHMVYGTCYRLLGSYHAEAEDVAQMVFIRVFKAAGRYQPKALFKTWLMTIVRNTVFSHLRKMKRHRERQVDWHDPEDPDKEPDFPDESATSADADMARGELLQCLQQAMENLPENQRVALVLRQYEQMSYEEIADSMGTTVSSVKSLIFRARDQLRAIVQKHREGSEK